MKMTSPELGKMVRVEFEGNLQGIENSIAGKMLLLFNKFDSWRWLPDYFIADLQLAEFSLKSFGAQVSRALPIRIQSGVVSGPLHLERKNDVPSKDTEVMVINGAHHLFDGDQSATFDHPRWGTVTVHADSSATEQARQKVGSLLKRVF